MQDAGSTGRWYIVHCKPLKEAMAANALREYLGLTVYMAEVQRRRQGEIKKAPFFRGYIFVSADLSQVKLSSINATPGVIRLLEFGGDPQPLEDDLMGAIMHNIEQLNEQGGIPPHSFRTGDRIVLQSGRFRSLDAIFVGPTKAQDRVKVLLKLLGGSHEVDVDVEDLERAPEQAMPKRERRTRGKGRPIGKVVD
jgi:transcriptional antiterminator RfaH